MLEQRQSQSRELAITVVEIPPSNLKLNRRKSKKPLLRQRKQPKKSRVKLY